MRGSCCDFQIRNSPTATASTTSAAISVWVLLVDGLGSGVLNDRARYCVDRRKISTRRLSCRPASVLLVPRGSDSPRPEVVMRDGSTPRSIR